MINTEIKSLRSFVDPMYKVGHKGPNFLSLQLGRDGLYAAALDLKTNTFIALEEHIFEGVQNTNQLLGEFRKSIENSTLLKNGFDKAVLGVVNEFSSLVPEALYDENKRSEFFEFTQGRMEDYTLADDRLTNLKARNLFALPALLKTAVAELLPTAKIKHASSALIDGLILKYKQRQGEGLVIHVQYSHFEILMFENGGLQYFNSFNYTTAEDFIYYTLFAIEQLGLNTEKVNVEIFGEVDASSNVYNLIYKYVRHVSFGERPNVLSYSPALDILPSNYYYSLFQQFLCA